MFLQKGQQSESAMYYDGRVIVILDENLAAVDIRETDRNTRQCLSVEFHIKSIPH